MKLKINHNQRKELKALIASSGKHAQYQQIPDFISAGLNIQITTEIKRYEKERFDFVLSNLSLVKKDIVDIGGNTGFFTFESLHSGAKHVTFIEGNPIHAKFVKNIADLLKFNVDVDNRYIEINSDVKRSDILFLLNVIHHLGDDFDSSKSTKADALKAMSELLKFILKKSDFIIFQMGFCWKGNREQLLFERGTKKEMIDFVEKSINGVGNIWKIGIAEVHDNQTIYKAPSKKNLKRIDDLGEFRNRPIFILKRKVDE